MNTGKVLLLVENDHDDAYLFEYALRLTLREAELHRACNGANAIDYLSGQGNYSNREVNPLPDLIFLDIKMPLMNGFQVMDWIRGSDESPNKDVHIVVLSGSDEPCDQLEAKKFGVAGYIVKSARAGELRLAIDGALALVS